MVDKLIPMTPHLNGGEKKRELLVCGCDPAEAKLDDNGRAMVYLVKQNQTFFEPLGARGFGMQITICAQCKEITGYQIMVPAIVPPPARGKIQLS